MGDGHRVPPAGCDVDDYRAVIAQRAVCAVTGAGMVAGAPVVGSRDAHPVLDTVHPGFEEALPCRTGGLSRMFMGGRLLAGCSLIAPVLPRLRSFAHVCESGIVTHTGER